MVQGYYTLDEAADILGMPTEKLSQMAQKREIRAFADRGTWRFRTQDVDEMARRLGRGPAPEAPPSPKSSVRRAKPPEQPSASGGVERDNVEIGQEVMHAPSASGQRRAGAGSSVRRVHDSDVQLVLDNDEGDLARDTGVRLSEPPASQSGIRSKKTMIPGGGKDSNVRLAPLDDDFEAVPVGKPQPGAGPDTPPRLEPSGSKIPLMSDDSNLTLDIDDLDAELRRAEEESKRRSGVQKPKTSLKKPASPFELSEGDLKPANKTPVVEDNSDFELTLGGNLSLDDEVSIGELSSSANDLSAASGASGINLHLPADTGINLEKAGSSEEIEFELSLDSSSASRVGMSASQADSDSEFELTLDDSGALSGIKPAARSGVEKDIFESDFEVPALDDESGSEAVALDDADTDLESSDFEFALSDQESDSQVVALDDGGDDIDESAGTVARSAKQQAALLAGMSSTSEEGENLFVEDFVADSEVEMSDDSDVEAEPEEEAEFDEDEEEAVKPTKKAVAAAAGAAAPWGVFPALMLFPTAIIMFVLMILSYEMLQSMWGFRQPGRTTGVLTKPIAEFFGFK